MNVPDLSLDTALVRAQHVIHMHMMCRPQRACGASSIALDVLDALYEFLRPECVEAWGMHPPPGEHEPAHSGMRSTFCTGCFQMWPCQGFHEMMQRFEEMA